MKKKYFILTISFLCIILLSACNLFESEPNNFLEDYSSIAYVNGAHGNGIWVEKDGWINISPRGMSEDYVVTFDIENPGNYELDCEILLSEDCIIKNFLYNCTNNSVRMIFSRNILENIDKNASQNNISPTIKLFRKTDNRPQYVYTLKMRCDSSFIEKLDPPYSNSDGVRNLNQDKNEDYATFVIYPPNGHDDATIEYEMVSLYEITTPSGTLEMQEGEIIYPNNSNDSISSGNITFQLYPNPDGSAAHYKVKHAVAKLQNYWDSDDGANTMGEDGIITVTGRLCDAKITSNECVFSIEDNEQAEYILTSSDSSLEIIYSILQTDKTEPIVSGTKKGPVTINLPIGTYNVSANVVKPYHQLVPPFSETVIVTSSVLYVSENGNDTTGDGSKEHPFKTLENAAKNIDADKIDKTGIDLITPINIIYFLTDMMLTENIMDGVPNNAALILCGCKGGEKGKEVTFYCNSTTGESFVVAIGSQKIVARNIIFSRSSGNTSTKSAIKVLGGMFMLQDCTVTGIKSDTGAVNISSGLFYIKDKVVITDNTVATDTTKLCNLYLNPVTWIMFAPNTNIEGTKIGITTSAEPTASMPVEFTNGYGTNINSAPSIYFTSDADYAVAKNSAGEAQLSYVGTGGSITIIDPAVVTFTGSSIGGAGGTVTITAKANGKDIPKAELSDWKIKLFQGAIDTGTSSTTNTITIPDNLDSGNYIIKVTVVFKGTTYSSELPYKFTKP